MHITEMQFRQMPPLGDVSFDCDREVNLFVGPNGTGKSTILRTIHRLYFSHNLSLPRSSQFSETLTDAEDDPLYPARVFDPSHESLGYARLWTSNDWPQDQRLWDPILWNTVPLLYVPAIRSNLVRSPSLLNQIFSIPQMNVQEFKNHGEKFLGVQDFDGERVLEFFQWARERLDLDQSQQYQLERVVRLGYDCTRRICSEVIHGAHPHNFEVPRGTGIRNAVYYDIKIETSDDILGEPLYAGVLSSGTQGTLLWLWALALTIGVHYDLGEDWEEQTAILLIDEVENHLHPTWQRRVIPALLEYFPGLQIFATTHSPFVVAGLKTGQVHLLKRNVNGMVTATTNEQDIIGWSADEILRTIMGVDEPTDQFTVDRANRLRQLREKETLTIAEDAELNALRHQVNEELLAKGGALEVERERYADLMERFLLSRQSEMTQDGG